MIDFHFRRHFCQFCMVGDGIFSDVSDLLGGAFQLRRMICILRSLALVQIALGLGRI